MNIKNIFESIRADHNVQRELAKKLTETSGDTKVRASLFKKLKHELVIHAQAEERFFYVPLIEEDMTQKHARHGVAEHHEIEELITQLEKTPMDSPGWLVYAKQLKHKVEHHLDEEEHTIFQLAGKVLSEDAKSSLENDYRQYMSKNDAGING